MTLFEQITADPETLAANIVEHAHRSIKTWAKMHGLKAEFSMEDYLFDLGNMMASLNREAFPLGELEIRAEYLDKREAQNDK
jgi:hypothetical protein